MQIDVAQKQKVVAVNMLVDVGIYFIV